MIMKLNYGLKNREEEIGKRFLFILYLKHIFTKGFILQH